MAELTLHTPFARALSDALAAIPAVPVEAQEEDECWVRQAEPDVLPPDMFSFNNILRKGLGKMTTDEVRDLMRQQWLSRDDEHWRYLDARDHTLHQRPALSDEVEHDWD